MANSIVKEVEQAVVSTGQQVIGIAVKAAVAAVLSYAVARVSGSHSAVLDALWATPPVTGLVHYLHLWLKA